MPSPPSTPASAAGAVLRGAFAGLGRLRPTDKPLHPRGVVLPATVHRHGLAERFGVPWLDDAGTDPALVRFSRGGGLPEALPDVLGIALRVRPDEAPADLLFATTGTSPLGRFLLVPRWAAAVSPHAYTTLQPYRAPTGAVVLSARPVEDDDRIVLHLAAARPTGRWREFATVTVEKPDGAGDRQIDFDPFLHPVPGLANYDWVRRLREGAYAAARRSRGR